MSVPPGRTRSQRWNGVGEGARWRSCGLADTPGTFYICCEILSDTSTSSWPACGGFLAFCCQLGSTGPKTELLAKTEGKTADSFVTNIIWLKMEKRLSEKLQRVDVKMHQNCQTSVKTFELEEQYAIIFSLALWPEEPHEVPFFKKSWFLQKLSSRNYKE